MPDLRTFRRRIPTEEAKKRVHDHKQKSDEIVASIEQGTEGVTLLELEDGYCGTVAGERDGVPLYCGKKTPSKRVRVCDDCRGGQRQKNVLKE